MAVSFEYKYAYSVVVDCGSTGSRVYLYKYMIHDPYGSLQSLGRVRVRPGLSTFTNDSIGLSDQLDHLLSFAHGKIPRVYWPQTKLTLRATAGMRKLGINESSALMSLVKSTLENKLMSKLNDDFQFDHDRSGIITGEKEALYDISAVMVAMKRDPNPFPREAKHVIDNSIVNRTYGVLDLGGSSMQYAFSESGADDYLTLVNTPAEYIPDKDLYLHSFSGLGLIDSMEEVLKTFYDNADNGRNLLDHHPCIPPGGIPVDGRDWASLSGVYGGIEQQIIPGSGDFQGCVSLIKGVLLPRMLSESGILCSDGKEAESAKVKMEVDATGGAYCESVSWRNLTPNVVVGLDNVPSLLFMLGLFSVRQAVENLEDVPLVSPADIAREGERVCAQPWESLLEQVDPSSSMKLPHYRGHRACFGSALLLVTLHEIVLRGCGNSGGIFSAENETTQPVSTQGILLPLDEIGTLGELSWTLGAALLDAYPIPTHGELGKPLVGGEGQL